VAILGSPSYPVKAAAEIAPAKICTPASQRLRSAIWVCGRHPLERTAGRQSL